MPGARRDALVLTAPPGAGALDACGDRASLTQVRPAAVIGGAVAW